MRLCVLFMGWAAILGISLSQAEPPRRIVSINLVSDIILMELVDHDRIAALSRISDSPHLSIIHEKAAAFPRTRGSAEELILLKPDLVIGTQWGQAPVLDLMQRLHVATHEIPLATSYDEISGLIRGMAQAVGDPERGEVLIERMNRRRFELQQSHGIQQTSAYFFTSSGFNGGGSLLQREILSDAGFAFPKDRSNRSSNIDLEELILHPPSVMIEASYLPDSPSLASLLLQHPAIQGLNLPMIRVPLAELLNATQESPRASETIQSKWQQSPSR